MSKPVLAYLITVDTVINDSETNKYSYIGLFQSINMSKSIGFIYVDFAIVGRIHNINLGDVNARIEIYQPGGTLFSKVDLVGKASSEKTHLYARFNNIKFSQTGTYTYKLFYNEVQYSNDDICQIEVKES